MDRDYSQNLHRSLLATLVYFDMFDYPLTLPELQQCRYRLGSDKGTAPLLSVISAVGSGGICSRDGFYFLEGRDDIVDTRKRRFRLAEAKFRKARRAAKFMRLLPTVRMVAVCNSLAISNADRGSDIDMAVVVRPGYIWITRLMIVGALALLGLRPKPGKHADRFCVSFFVSEDCMDLRHLALPGGDAHFRYWMASFVPLYDAGGVFEGFMKQNIWITDRLSESALRKGPSSREVGPRPGWLDAFLPVLKRLERPARRYQMKRFPEEICSLMNKDSRVVVSDRMLKFHVNDRRAHYEELFMERLRALDLC